MAIQKTEAFVLRTQPFRSSSLIITTFSRSFGKVKGIVKGVRKEGAARPGTFEPFTLLEIVFYEKIRSELHLISEATILETFESLRSELEPLASAYYLAELVDQLTEIEDSHETIFELLHFVFRFLPSIPSAFLIRFFEIRLLHEIGLFPHLSNCLGCGAKDFDRVSFSVKQGGIFCPLCSKKSSGAKWIRPETLKGIRFFVEGGVSEGARASFPEQVQKEMGELVDQFLIERLPNRLKSRRFLDQVRSLKKNRGVTPKPTAFAQAAHLANPRS